MGFIQYIKSRIKKAKGIQHKKALDLNGKEKQFSKDKHDGQSNLLINKSGGQPW